MLLYLFFVCEWGGGGHVAIPAARQYQTSGRSEGLPMLERCKERERGAAERCQGLGGVLGGGRGRRGEPQNAWIGQYPLPPI